MDYQTIIETFFSMLGRFDFDRAKLYIDGRKDVLQKLAPTFPHQAQLMVMLTTFSHLAEVEKNYHHQPYPSQTQQHSFLPTNFLYKTKSLRTMYADIHNELKALERLQTKAIDEDVRSDDSESIDATLVATSSNQTTQLRRTVAARHHFANTVNSDQQSSTSSSTEKDSPNVPTPPSPASTFKNTFFRVLSPISSSANTNAISDSYSISVSSGYEPPPNSTTTTPIAYIKNVKEFSDELISHFCRQLQTFIQARLDMVTIYEKLIEASTQKFTAVDGAAYRLSSLCRQYHKSFHHPLLAPIKEGMTLECESLMNLIRATIHMRHLRFLPSLFDIQDAQSKLNFWASNTFNKDTTKRRFKVPKALSAPRLYEWLCRYKDFLISKFSLYFQATLANSFPPANLRNLFSKLTVDFYSKLANFQRKIDANFIALMYDVSQERDFRGLGYNYPSSDYQQPQGKNTLQYMVVIPGESKTKLASLQAEIYMIVTTSQQAMARDGLYQFHDTTKKLTYSIAKPDLNVALVIVCDGQKADRDALVRSFTIDITNQLSLSSLFTN